jgi:hypothetical protein
MKDLVGLLCLQPDSRYYIYIVSKKKRNKQYKGSVSARPQITRMSAVDRNKAHQWWIDNQRIARPVLITAGIVLVIILVIIGIIGLIW